MLTKESLRDLIKNWLGPLYNEKAAEKDNPDWFGPAEVDDLVEEIRVWLESDGFTLLG